MSLSRRILIIGVTLPAAAQFLRYHRCYQPALPESIARSARRWWRRGCVRVPGSRRTLGERAVAEANPNTGPKRPREIPGARVFRQPARSSPDRGALALRPRAFLFAAGSVRRPSLAPMRIL